MSAAPKLVPWARRVRTLVLPEESLPVPERFECEEVDASGVSQAGCESGRRLRLVPGSNTRPMNAGGEITAA